MAPKFGDILLCRTIVWSLLLVWLAILGARAHVAAWNKGMYCLNGTTPGIDNSNTNDAVMPLYQLKKSDWWMHHVNGCDKFPPAPGDFLELPANGQFTIELAGNRAFTSLSSNGTNAGVFGDGQAHPELEGVVKSPQECITSPNLHTRNESMAAGTVFAISYTSDITKVKPENLVVFTVLAHTPWKRLATYKVPNLPACPDGGCICTWGWVPNGCGETNMYMQPLRCKVTGKPGSAPVKPAVPPVWCEDDKRKCVSGPKQMIFWNQLEGNNVVVSGTDLAGEEKSPTYNSNMGFANGPQTDIFDVQTMSAPVQTQNPTPILPLQLSTASARSVSNAVEHRVLWAMFLPTLIALVRR